MPQTGTSNLGYQNKFTTTLTSGISSTDTTIGLNSLPTPSEGFLVLEPDSATAWEVIYYTSKTGSAVVCPSSAAGRGQDDSTAQSHSSGATVRMDTTAGMFEVLQNGSSLGINAVGSASLATSAIKLGYAELTTTFSTATTGSYVATGLTVTVTVPAGGRDLEVVFDGVMTNNGSSGVYTAIAIFESSTVIQMKSPTLVGTSYNMPVTLIGHVSAPTAGSHTYSVSIASNSGTTSLQVGTGAYGTSAYRPNLTAKLI